jgi:hypothetical protein
MTVLEMMPPPELHLLTGTVQLLYAGLQRIWPPSGEWLAACHVQQDQMHGGSFTGNASRKLLRSVDQLSAMCPLPALRFASAFRAFNNVVESCFGNVLLPNFAAALNDFRSSFAELEIAPTPKVHAVIHHVGEFCRLKKRGLGPWSEQTSESLHFDFLQLWQHYKISESHLDYPARLLSAVRVYNSRHL